MFRRGRPSNIFSQCVVWFSQVVCLERATVHDFKSVVINEFVDVGWPQHVANQKILR